MKKQSEKEATEEEKKEDKKKVSTGIEVKNTRTLDCLNTLYLF